MKRLFGFPVLPLCSLQFGDPTPCVCQLVDELIPRYILIPHLTPLEWNRLMTTIYNTSKKITSHIKARTAAIPPRPRAFSHLFVAHGPSKLFFPTRIHMDLKQQKRLHCSPTSGELQSTDIQSNSTCSSTRCLLQETATPSRNIHRWLRIGITRRLCRISFFDTRKGDILRSKQYCLVVLSPEPRPWSLVDKQVHNEQLGFFDCLSHHNIPIGRTRDRTLDQ
ncbi:MAG: hypothetical protein A4E62_02262 [Syntrophorhabdus sp. PtaU1.Bin002]|nr:MAG: hypothetical protein A4E62_02262 [Syntrophorhabdus sp. PtaU1.Bin002]